MPTIGANALTLIDWGKRLDPMGKVAMIAELLSQTNEILRDMLWIEGNLPTGHRTTVRTGLPNVFWRLLNQGTQPTKSTTAQIDEGIGMLEAWSEVDKDLAELNGNVGAFRLSEAQAFLEAMNQELAQTVFFGNSSLQPEEFNGYSVRYSSLGASNGQNIIDGGGTGSDNSSIWLVGWGQNTTCGIFPKNSQAGLRHTDLGEGVIETTAGIAGNRMMGYRDRWQWKAGIALKDWRYVVRIANIDISELVAKSGSAADLFDLMIKATHVVPNLSGARFSFYMNRTTFQMLDIQGRDDMVGSALQYSQVTGMRIPTFRNIPIGIVDALTETEAQVT
jgi:hypothetical protein